MWYFDKRGSENFQFSGDFYPHFGMINEVEAGVNFINTLHKITYIV